MNASIFDKFSKKKTTKNGNLLGKKDIFDKLSFSPQSILTLLVYFVKLMRNLDCTELLFLKGENNLFQQVILMENVFLLLQNTFW